MFQWLSYKFDELSFCSHSSVKSPSFWWHVLLSALTFSLLLYKSFKKCVKPTYFKLRELSVHFFNAELALEQIVAIVFLRTVQILSRDLLLLFETFLELCDARVLLFEIMIATFNFVFKRYCRTVDVFNFVANDSVARCQMACFVAAIDIHHSQKNLFKSPSKVLWQVEILSVVELQIRFPQSKFTLFKTDSMIAPACWISTSWSSLLWFLEPIFLSALILSLTPIII